MEGMNTNIMDINRILDEARNLGCSDLHFTAGLPPVVRLHGSIRKLSGYPDCTEPIIVNIINQITSIKHKSQISKGLDTDFSYVSTAGFRHRVNVYRQRGYHAVAIRLLRNDIPTLADLSLPATLGEFAMAPRGLVLVTGPTGSGKSTTPAPMTNNPTICKILGKNAYPMRIAAKMKIEARIPMTIFPNFCSVSIRCGGGTDCMVCACDVHEAFC